jgi:hypothetical protein
MFYKYTFYKLFKWARVGSWENASYPHLSAIYLLALLILSNAYFILVLLDKLQLFKFNGDFIYSTSAKILFAVFISTLLFNHLYFYWINKWREIVNYFKDNNVSSKINSLSNIYIAFSVLSFLAIYLFNL